jgi:hypothetical protein
LTGVFAIDIGIALSKEMRATWIARNASHATRLFGEVNERVREVRAEEGDDMVGFLCECGDESCTETVRLSVEEYEAVRSEPTHFAALPGHEIRDLERPIHVTDRFVVVQKFPEEAAAAIETDPRS